MGLWPQFHMWKGHLYKAGPYYRYKWSYNPYKWPKINRYPGVILLKPYLNGLFHPTYSIRSVGCPPCSKRNMPPELIESYPCKRKYRDETALMAIRNPARKPVEVGSFIPLFATVSLKHPWVASQDFWTINNILHGFTWCFCACGKWNCIILK